MPSASEGYVEKGEAFGMCQEQGSFFLAKEDETSVFHAIWQSPAAFPSLLQLPCPSEGTSGRAAAYAYPGPPLFM